MWVLIWHSTRRTSLRSYFLIEIHDSNVKMESNNWHIVAEINMYLYNQFLKREFTKRQSALTNSDALARIQPFLPIIPETFPHACGGNSRFVIPGLTCSWQIVDKYGGGSKPQKVMGRLHDLTSLLFLYLVSIASSFALIADHGILRHFYISKRVLTIKIDSWKMCSQFLMQCKAVVCRVGLRFLC